MFIPCPRQEWLRGRASIFTFIYTLPVLFLFYSIRASLSFLSSFRCSLFILFLPSILFSSLLFLFLLAVILFLPLSCLPPELPGSRKTSFFYMFLVLKLTCLSLADIIRSVTSA